MNKFIFIAFLYLFNLSCINNPAEMINEDAAVYSTCLDSFYVINKTSFGREVNSLLIIDSTGVDDMLDIIEMSLTDRLDLLKPVFDDYYPQISDSIKWGEITSSFIKRNVESVSLFNDKLTAKKPIKLVSQSRIKQLFSKNNVSGNGWLRFHDEYPHSDGFLHLSRVGFTKDKTQALVFIARHAGGTDGSGIYYICINQKSKWKIVAWLPSWES